MQWNLPEVKMQKCWVFFSVIHIYNPSQLYIRMVWFCLKEFKSKQNWFGIPSTTYGIAIGGAIANTGHSKHALFETFNCDKNVYLIFEKIARKSSACSYLKRFCLETICVGCGGGGTLASQMPLLLQTSSNSQLRRYPQFLLFSASS